MRPQRHFILPAIVLSGVEFWLHAEQPLGVDNPNRQAETTVLFPAAPDFQTNHPFCPWLAKGLVRRQRASTPDIPFRAHRERPRRRFALRSLLACLGPEHAAAGKCRRRSEQAPANVLLSCAAGGRGRVQSLRRSPGPIRLSPSTRRAKRP